MIDEEDLFLKVIEEHIREKNIDDVVDNVIKLKQDEYASEILSVSLGSSLVNITDEWYLRLLRYGKLSNSKSLRRKSKNIMEYYDIK